jgi:carbamoyl-phosphate synthase large subunit
VHFFREALGPCGKVFAADASMEAPALWEADKAFVLPQIGDPCYVTELLVTCQDWDVGLLIPLNDFELPLLAAYRNRFRAIGTFPVVASPEVVETCFDKWVTYAFLQKHGIPTPHTYLSLSAAQDARARGEIGFPLVLKPRWGSGSVGIEYVEDEDELALAYALSSNRYVRALPRAYQTTTSDQCILIQERLRGHEYGLDIVNDLAGQYVCTLAKRKLVMRFGETDRAVTVQDERLTQLGVMLGGLLGHVGSLDCDTFVQGDTCYVVELNPRFGGGYPLAHAAGANVPAALVAWARGEVPDPKWFELTPGVIGAKCDRIVVMNDPVPATVD